MERLPKVRTLLQNLSPLVITHLHVFLDQHHRQLGYQNGNNIVSHSNLMQEVIFDRPSGKVGSKLEYDILLPDDVSNRLNEIADKEPKLSTSSEIGGLTYMTCCPRGP